MRSSVATFSPFRFLESRARGPALARGVMVELGEAGPLACPNWAASTHSTGPWPALPFLHWYGMDLERLG